jgi:hypothetical protein
LKNFKRNTQDTVFIRHFEYNLKMRERIRKQLKTPPPLEKGGWMIWKKVAERLMLD